MLTDNPFVIAASLHPEYYENIERYRSTDAYLAAVRGLLGEGWIVRPGGFWTSCDPPPAPGRAERPQSGWKIHVSAVPSTAVETLRRVVPLVVRRGIGFKYCADPWVFTLSLLKNSSRSQAGKFITVYPGDVDLLKEVIEELHGATRDLRGPFVLSDRPYKDSKVVFYRYGEYFGSARAAPNGSLLRGFQAPDGAWQADERSPYFRLPAWVADPFTDLELPKAPGESGVLLAGRYRVKGAFRFSAIGGIYTGEDTRTGATVVIREARPMVGIWESGGDSISLLEKEARILEKLGPTGYTPRFHEMFRQWEHHFLVQESLSAESLWGHSMNFYFRDADLSPAESFEMLRGMIRKLITGLQVVHDHGVVLRDLTKNNVMITLDGAEVKFIDFEFAFELDRDDPPIAGWTPGYASPDQLENRMPAPDDDHYALGALILDIISYSVSGIELNRAGVLAALRATLSDLRFPDELYQVVTGLIDESRERRWSLARALDVLEAAPSPPAGERLFANVNGAIPARDGPAPRLLGELSTTLADLEAFFVHSADFDRDDRLWPPSPSVFVTNPVSFQYGAAGGAYFLLRRRGEAPAAELDWIERHLPADPPLPPGLYSGAAGVALLFLEAGREDRAREILAAGDQPDLVYRWPGLFYGAAGWGLANLHFWRRTGEERYLDAALAAGEHLIRSAREEATGLSWQTEGQTRLGFGEGASGVATFLIFLNACRPDRRVLETAVKAVDYDVSMRQEDSGMVSWYPLSDSPPSHPKSPHMWFGTAGIGAAVLRCHAATGEERLLEFARRCASAVSTRYTNKLWQDFGLSGFGELLLDMHRFLGGGEYLANAYHLAEALLPHRIPRGRGIAFAGEDLFRITCDFGCGGAGIGIFLHRLLEPRTPRVLMLDELILPAEGAAGLPGGVRGDIVEVAGRG
jgi:serine/threonine protein kinase